MRVEHDVLMVAKCIFLKPFWSFDASLHTAKAIEVRPSAANLLVYKPFLQCSQASLQCVWSSPSARYWLSRQSGECVFK